MAVTGGNSQFLDFNMGFGGSGYDLYEAFRRLNNAFTVTSVGTYVIEPLWHWWYGGSETGTALLWGQQLVASAIPDHDNRTRQSCVHC